MKPQSFIFIGRAGAGKGTQAKLLIKALEQKYADMPVLYCETGAELRKFAEENNYTSTITKEIINSGRLVPEFMCVHMWGRLLVERFKGNENLVFDGTPRKLLEAKLLSGLFPFYSLEKPFVIYLDIEHEESHKRLSLRAKQGRKDDTPEGIEKRRLAFETDVMPCVEYYKSNADVNFLDVDGERPIEVVHADIVKRVGLA